MDAETREPVSFATELRAGWRAGLGATVGMATGASLYLLTNGFFVKPLGHAFHWTRGQIALGAFASLLGAVATPVAGWLSDRWGTRPVGAAGLAFVAAAFVGLATMDGDIAHFYLWLAAMATLGAAASAIVLSRPLAQAFDRFRGAALGLGLGLSALIVTLVLPATQAVISFYGWRAGYLFLASLPAVIGLGAVLWLAPRQMVPPQDVAVDRAGGSLASALRDRRFWLIFVAMLTANLCFGGLLGQLPAMLTDRGISPIQAGFVMSFLTAATIAGRILNGVAMDRLWAPGVAAATLLVPVGGLMLLLAQHAGLPRAIAAVLLIGMAQGGEATILSFFTARYFGFRAYGAIYGALAIAISLALAGGGAMFGLVYDWTRAYDAAIFVAAGGLVVAAACLACTGISATSSETGKRAT